MQAVILCGGFGTCIRDVADDNPKPMIPIGDMPILWHIMKGYSQFGIRDFVLCLGHRGSTIKRWFRDYHLAKSDYTIDLSRPGEAQYHGDEEIEDWRITFADTGLNSMTGARVKRIEQYIAGDTFMVTYGDGVADVDISDLLDFHTAGWRPSRRYASRDGSANSISKATAWPSSRKSLWWRRAGSMAASSPSTGPSSTVSTTRPA